MGNYGYDVGGTTIMAAIMITKQIPEQKIDGKRLGRHVVHDERSWNFLAEKSVTITSIIHTSVGLPLTQVRGSCTAEAMCGDLNSQTPLPSVPLTQVNADHLYDLEITDEGGNPATDDPGGSGLEICKVALAQGLIKSYTHAMSMSDALGALMLRPVITGVNWYDSFDAPSSSGFITISPNAQVRGGHEFVVDEIDTVTKAVGCWNSWGLSYGLQGRFYMPFTVWDRLLGEQGDVTVPVV